jgi:D-glycero-D-manno-heptose 1,7-bisphosphate phosphatase
MNKNTLKPSQGKETEANSGNLLPAVFIDRDGTLMEEVHYCNDPSQVAVFSGAADALQALRRAGYRTIMVTNQSGIAKGLITQEQYEAVHAQFLEGLGSSLLDATYMCADASGSPSLRRKPAPGMLLEAAEDWNLDLGRSWIIGDKTIDIECGAAVGVPGVLVLTGHGRGQDASGAVYIAENFAEAVRWILR